MSLNNIQKIFNQKQKKKSSYNFGSSEAFDAPALNSKPFVTQS